MPSLSSGQNASVILAPGESYTVSTTGTAAVKGVYGAPSTTTLLTANFAKFGPYGVPAKLDIACASGVASYTLDQFDGVPVYGETNVLTGGIVNLIWNGTQAQYDAIAVKDPATLYVIVG